MSKNFVAYIDFMLILMLYYIRILLINKSIDTLIAHEQEDYMTNCNLMEICIPSECPADIECPYDFTADTQKDRSISRKRHHDDVKAKKKSFICAKILSAKANRIPDLTSNNERNKKATETEQIPGSTSNSKRNKKATKAAKATKKCQKFKRQKQEQEQNSAPYRK